MKREENRIQSNCVIFASTCTSAHNEIHANVGFSISPYNTSRQLRLYYTYFNLIFCVCGVCFFFFSRILKERAGAYACEFCVLYDKYNNFGAYKITYMETSEWMLPPMYVVVIIVIHCERRYNRTQCFLCFSSKHTAIVVSVNAWCIETWIHLSIE